MYQSRCFYIVYPAIVGLQNLHQFPYQDTAVSTLAQRLLDLESESLGQMRAYL